MTFQVNANIAGDNHGYIEYGKAKKNIRPLCKERNVILWPYLIDEDQQLLSVEHGASL